MVPAAQSVQAVWPELPAYFPAGQSGHPLLTKPVDEAFPVVHASQPLLAAL